MEILDLCGMFMVAYHIKKVKYKSIKMHACFDKRANCSLQSGGNLGEELGGIDRLLVFERRKQV